MAWEKLPTWDKRMLCFQASWKSIVMDVAQSEQKPVARRGCPGLQQGSSHPSEPWPGPSIRPSDWLHRCREPGSRQQRLSKSSELPQSNFSRFPAPSCSKLRDIVPSPNPAPTRPPSASALALRQHPVLPSPLHPPSFRIPRSAFFVFPPQPPTNPHSQCRSPWS